MPATETPSATIDFASAQNFLDIARKAHDKGDDVQCLAARKLVALALNLSESPMVKIHTSHLSK